MAEAGVVYSEVRFTKSTGNAAGSHQEVVLNGGSKVTAERVAIAVLSALLAAAVIALVFTSHKYIQTIGRLSELTAVNRNLTDRCCEAETPGEEQNTCPAGVNTTELCAKCQKGWEQDRTQCYHFSNNMSRWEEARTECQHRGGDLVRIDSREEQKFLHQKVREKMKSGEDKFWIGLTDAQTEGTWLWADGSLLSGSLNFWSGSQPDDWKQEDPDGEDCVRMGEKRDNMYSWFDKSCNVPHRSICEKPADTGYLMCV